MVTFVFLVYSFSSCKYVGGLSQAMSPATRLARSHAECTGMSIPGASVPVSGAESEPFTLRNVPTPATTLAET